VAVQSPQSRVTGDSKGEAARHTEGMQEGTLTTCGAPVTGSLSTAPRPRDYEQKYLDIVSHHIRASAISKSYSPGSPRAGCHLAGGVG